MLRAGSHDCQVCARRWEVWDPQLPVEPLPIVSEYRCRHLIEDSRCGYAGPENDITKSNVPKDILKQILLRQAFAHIEAA